MSALELDSLPIHLRGGETAHQLLELLIAHQNAIVVGNAASDQWQRLDSASLVAGGFDDAEALLPGEPSFVQWIPIAARVFLAA